ncbi:MAG TPA: hypothetical protein VIU29_07045, partial [Candidatus Deferrimicrobiaceae bacterium]
MKTADPVGTADSSADNDPAKQRRERIAIGIVAVIVLGLTLLEANLATIGSAIGYSGNIAIFALINVNVILIVLLIFLVTRNVFKLILDRRRNILGSRIRSRLVVLFTAFSLIPTILLFIAAATITTTNIKSWIGGRVGVALTDALEIARKELNSEAGAMKELVARMAPDFTAGENGASSLSVLPEGADNTISLHLLKNGAPMSSDGNADPAVMAEIVSRFKGGGKPGQEGIVTFIGNSYAAAAM